MRIMSSLIRDFAIQGISTTCMIAMSLCHMINSSILTCIWASMRQNLSSGCPKKLETSLSPQLQRLAVEIEISLVAS